MHYDIAIKLRVVEEYEAGGMSYQALSDKYSINMTTIASWVQKYKKNKSLVIKEEPKFLDITDESKKKVVINNDNNLIPFIINGLEIKTNELGIRAILESLRR